jgi:hypothetical protein
VRAPAPLAFKPVDGSPSIGPLAQLAEQRTFNPRVPGSIPGRPTAPNCSFAVGITPTDLAWGPRGAGVSAR